MVPRKFLSKIGNYVVPIDETKLQVKVVDTAAGIDQVVVDKLNAASYNIIGLDYKTVVSPAYTRPLKLLVLCILLEGGLRYSIVVHLNYITTELPESFKKLLRNHDICFVTASQSPAKCLIDYMVYIDPIQVGDLASRVLNKPNLLRLSLAQIASQVGVPSLEFSNSSEIQVKQENARVLILDQVKMAVLDAYACAKIADNLLNSR